MFSIERVTLTNFRSFIGAHVFDLPTEPGLYNLTGKNLINPNLGANAAGKSSLLDAIYWCLYGRTTRALKANDVVTWGRKGCQVVLWLDVGGVQKQVARTQNPNSLTLGGSPIDQQALEQYLRLTPEAFLYAVMIPQFGQSFFDLTPALKLTLFSDILGLDYWLERSQAADKLAKELENERAQTELKVAKIQGQRETAKADIVSLREHEASFIDTQAEAIRKLHAELQQAAQNHTADAAEITGCRNVLASCEAKIAALVSKSVCPTCNQNVPSADLTAIRKNKADFEDKVRRLQYQQQTAKRKQGELQIAIAREVERVNPYSEMISEKRHLLGRLKLELTVLAAKATKLAEEHAAVSFWVAGFKRVRLFIIEDTLRQLELEVNNTLTSLGLMEWRIGFDVERENKSGGIIKGFVVLIYPPGSEQPVRYESYSGGETQRLRMAGDLGLANLIMERAGLTNTVEFFDEPSRHLSQEGLLDLAESLCQRAASQGKRILLVDHHVLDFGGFAATYIVVKDTDGSRCALL